MKTLLAWGLLALAGSQTSRAAQVLQDLSYVDEQGFGNAYFILHERPFEPNSSQEFSFGSGFMSLSLLIEKGDNTDAVVVTGTVIDQYRGVFINPYHFTMPINPAVRETNTGEYVSSTFHPGPSYEVRIDTHSERFIWSFHAYTYSQVPNTIANWMFVAQRFQYTSVPEPSTYLCGSTALFALLLSRSKSHR